MTKLNKLKNDLNLPTIIYFVEWDGNLPFWLRKKEIPGKYLKVFKKEGFFLTKEEAFDFVHKRIEKVTLKMKRALEELRKKNK